MILFFIFALLSVPAFIFYGKGSSINEKENNAKPGISSISLGNLGESEGHCSNSSNQALVNGNLLNEDGIYYL
jgi:hypothetical protein